LAAEVAIKLAVFAAAVGALAATGHTGLALVFGAVAVVNVAVEYAAV